VAVKRRDDRGLSQMSRSSLPQVNTVESLDMIRTLCMTVSDRPFCVRHQNKMDVEHQTIAAMQRSALVWFVIGLIIILRLE
jgi:hypothetical protein